MNPGNKAVLERIDNEARTEVGSGWYGDTTYEEMTRPINQFKDMGLVDEVYRDVSDHLPQNVKSKLKERKLLFNAQGLGVFSFDRLMMGMFKKPAFWSVSQQKYVAPNAVYQNAEGEYKLTADNSDIEVHEKLTTNNKKVFAYFPELEKDNNAIEIVMVAGANGDTSAREMLYTGVAGIVMAELCQKAGIKVRLSIILGSINGEDMVADVIPMKDFNQPIDKNVLALLTSDARVFRYDMFKGIVALYDKFGLNCPRGLGSLITKRRIEEVYRTDDTFKKLFKANKVYFTSGIFSKQAAIATVTEIINDLTN